MTAAITTTEPASERLALVGDGFDRGWSFTPLNGKRPTLMRWQTRERETREQALAWAAAGNVGLRTGSASGVVVVDVDPGADAEALDLPATVAAQTGRPGGRHLYFRYAGPLGNSAGKLAPHVDVKADGGQVVFPGSVHPDTGGVYAWADGLAPWQVDLAELPPAIVAALTAPKNPARYAAAALNAEAARVAEAPEGQRNTALNRAAFSIGQLVAGGQLTQGEAENALAMAARAAGLPDGEAAATIRSGLDGGQAKPRTAPPLPVKARPVATAYTLDLAGNANRFERLFGDNALWCDEAGRWYIWDGRIWAPDVTRCIHKAGEEALADLSEDAARTGDAELAKWAAKCARNGQARKDLLDVVKHRRAVRFAEFDADPWVLGVENGAIDLRTGRLLPHDRRRMLSKLAPVEYSAEADAPRWTQFLREIMGGDDAMAGALQRLAGYFLTGDISVQILPILWGGGANGKSVFVDTLLGIMGPHAGEAPDGLVTARMNDEHPTEIADLAGKRLVVASENEEGRKLRAGLVKKLTGNRFLKARFMRADYFQFQRTHKLALVTNNKPAVGETSHAIWRRLRLIPFAVTIPEERQDRDLTEKLIAEWPGILAWGVRGCLDWQARGGDLAFPGAVSEATAEYREEADHVADFLAEAVQDWRQFPQQAMRVSKERLYSAYVRWAHAAGEDVLARAVFNARMRGHGFADKTARIDGKPCKVWADVTLQSNDE